MNHTASNYQKVEVETTDPLKLVVVLYEGAINFLEQAKKRLEQNQIADKGILINKVVAILSELQGSLNLENGGEFAARLDGLYTYLINRLLEANVNNDVAPLNEVSAHLRSLKDAWRKISDNGNQAETANQQTSPGMEIPTPEPAHETPDRSAPIELLG